MEPNEIDLRVLSLQRTFNAPIQLVWEAWSQPEHIAHWWGPRGMKVNVEEMDFSTGGKWMISMTMPDGNKFITEGTYQEINPPNKIVTTADFKPMTENVVLTVLFEDLGEQTKMTFSVLHETEEYARAQEKMGFMNGWGSVFSNLEEYLEGNNQ